MSKRVRINGERLRALRRSPAMVAKLMTRGAEMTHRANADFELTASKKDKQIQEHAASSPTPYDMSVRVGSDRARVYVQTASVAARRHESSVWGSSLLRAKNG